jgi:hypothetical protein
MLRHATVYIRPNGDDENDGSENAPVKSPKRAITIANRNKDQEINLLTTDWARINRELGRAEEDEFPQGGGQALVIRMREARCSAMPQ